MKKLGLIGYPLSHSFSKKYFSDKFEELDLTDWSYDLYPLQQIDDLMTLLQTEPEIVGLNVTIPYKEQVIPFLDHVSESAAAIGAVNTIVIREGKLTGYNSDVFGFEESLTNFIKAHNIPRFQKALILGTGGAAKGVAYVLDKLKISYLKVSRSSQKGDITYQELTNAILAEHRLIINTTPLGMAPNTDSCPDLDYSCLSGNHLLYDLVYNPEKTLFLKKGQVNGAYILNGLAMLHGQAEKSWQIWNS